MKLVKKDGGVGGGSLEQLSRTLGLREEKSREEVPLSFGALPELVGMASSFI